MTKKPERIDLSQEELDALLSRVESGSLAPGDYELIKAMAETIAYLSQAADKKSATIARLIRTLFGSKSEKTEDVLSPEQEAHASSHSGKDEPDKETAPKKGHGRRGAKEYRGAERVRVKHETLKPGDDCPECEKGTVYLKPPKQVVCIRGGPPLSGKVYEFDRLRCGLCGAIFTASVPEGLDLRKYDETSASMIALLKYGSGLPFNRLARLEGSLGIPLPAATQWDIVNEAAKPITPVHEEFIRQAAHGEVIHNDDTGMKILEHMGKRLKKKKTRSKKKKRRASKSKERSGVFTSGIVSVGEGRKIVLFFTGRKHAGENLSEVLSKRSDESPMPIQMCDALSRNQSAEFKTLLANCLAHGRRQFVDVSGSFPQECRHVLETLGEVYKLDARAREKSLTPAERLAFHREHSRPLMVKLLNWFRRELRERRIEPNSPLGEAIAYMKKHWHELTLFYRRAGAPLDNNVCERALKKAILHRKNAYFYKTDHGASVGDLFMSLIYTAELSGADPFDYLNELQRHSEKLSLNPALWMPWNYRETLATLQG